MKTKIKGKVSISQKSELLIDGNVTLNDLDLDGALRLLADGELGSKDLLTIAADSFVARHAQVRANHFARHIARITWAFAKLDFHHEKFQQILMDRLQPENYVIRFLEPDQLHALLWSFRRLGLDKDKWTKTRTDIEAKVMCYIKMRYRHGIGAKVDEFGDTRLHKITIGRIEPYVEIDPTIPKPFRNRAMLRKATELGEAGPDVPNVRRKISGRPKWSVTEWVDPQEDFISHVEQQQKLLKKASAMKQLEAGQSGDDSNDQLIQYEGDPKIGLPLTNTS
eukprot:g32040.t1